MEFALSEEQRLFADSLRGLLADRVTIDALRRHSETGSGFDAELWGSLVELGLPGLLVPERFGGAGLGVLDAAVAAEVIGGAAAFVPFAGSIVMATLAFMHSAIAGIAGGMAATHRQLARCGFGVGFSRTADARRSDRRRLADASAGVSAGRPRRCRCRRARHRCTCIAASTARAR